MERQTFTDDKSFTNLEIGVGCGNFGRIYYSKCYLADCDLELKKICDECHIDWFCDAHKLTWKNDQQFPIWQKTFQKFVTFGKLCFDFRLFYSKMLEILRG